VYRRQFLKLLTAGTAGAVAAPPLLRALAGGELNERRFLFIFATGGWDPLCVFAPNFGAAGTIDMEPDAVALELGDFRLVDHPQRPAVRSFFETWGARTAVVNGISVRSVAHDICTQLLMTSSQSGSEPDWPSTIAAGASQLALPDLVLSGPSFPGEHSGLVSRVGASYQLQWLIDDTAFDYVDDPVRPLPFEQRSAIDAFVADRAEQAVRSAAGTGAEPLLSRLRDAFPRAEKLRELGASVRFDNGETEEDGAAIQLVPQLEPALTALSSGASRVVTIGVGDWDSHEDNARQTPLFEALFAQLATTCERLQVTAGPDGAPLLDTTTVVVLSEMGRTPRYNGAAGRDHWPYTSAMLIGSGVRGGRSVGAYDDRFTGVGVDPASGDLIPGAPAVTTAELGATLLELAAAPAPEHLAGVSPLRGVLS
jgi:uncharacterized protein (DUF1501 family)